MSDHGTFRIPVRTKSVANLREHWTKKAERTKAERAAARAAWLGAARPKIDLPAVVTLTRIAPRPLDSDNLARSCKAIRDELAAIVGVDDRDDRIDWRYEQTRGGKGEYAVTVEWMGRAAWAAIEAARLAAVARGGA